MKKFLAMMLAVLMLLSMATVAFAEGVQLDESGLPATTPNPNIPANQENINGRDWNIGYLDNGDSFTLKKVYTNGEYAPNETFTFTFSGTGELPSATDVSNTNGALSNNGTFTVTLPTYAKVGTYQYTMTETAGSTAGVVYDTEVRTLMVYVENKEGGGFKCQVALYKGTSIEDKSNKSDTFTNVYNQGTAMITKRVDSTVAADKANRYNFTITLSNVNDVDYTGVVVDANGAAVQGADNVTIHGTTATTFTLTDGQSLKIEHLPNGASYTVKETKPSADPSHNGSVTVKYDDENAAYDENGTSTNGATGSITTDATATSTIANNFAYTGDLVVKKIVTGNLGDEGKWFTFTVTGITNDTEVDKDEKVRNAGIGEDGKYTFEMQHGGSITFKDLPYGTSYTVTEEADGYTPTKAFVEKNKNGNPVENQTTEGTIDQATEEFTFSNDNQQPIETGVSLDTLPYVLVLALAGAGLVMMIARKRRVQD